LRNGIREVRICVYFHGGIVIMRSNPVFHAQPVSRRCAAAIGAAFAAGLLALGMVNPAAGQQADGKLAKVASAVEAHSAASASPDILRQLNDSLEGLVKRVSPGVVQVLVTGYGPLEEKGEQDTAVVTRQHAIGSGVIVDPDGYIITNRHVVNGAQSIRVALPYATDDSGNREGSMRVLDAKLVGIHSESDLALLKIEAHGLPTLPFADSSRVRPGQLVFAIGSPEGLTSTVTMGVVSATARQPDPDNPMVYLQTDAPINPGNSGGPLVNLDGEVVGINTFIISESGGSQGLGFAIPAQIAKFVYTSLRKYGHVHRGEMGAVAQTITPRMAAGLGLRQDYGVIIADVLPAGPAQTGGLQIGDIVETMDGRPVNALPAFAGALYLHPLDKPLEMDVLRGNKRESLLIPVVEQKHSIDQMSDLADPAKNMVPRLGILVVEINGETKSLLPDLREPAGVVVAARTFTPAGLDSGLAAGDVIHRLNRTPVISLDGLRKAVDALKPGDPVVLQIEREGQYQFIPFELE
jgi:serine protease Do